MASPTLSEIEELLWSKEEAERKSEFAESIKCTATVIEGDRYKITFSDHSEIGG